MLLPGLPLGGEFYGGGQQRPKMRRLNLNTRQLYPIPFDNHLGPNAWAVSGMLFEPSRTRYLDRVPFRQLCKYLNISTIVFNKNPQRWGEYRKNRGIRLTVHLHLHTRYRIRVNSARLFTGSLFSIRRSKFTRERINMERHPHLLVLARLIGDKHRPIRKQHLVIGFRLTHADLPQHFSAGNVNNANSSTNRLRRTGRTEISHIQ